MVDIKNIPAELKTSCRFCVWKFEKRNGQKTKMPYNPANGDRARINDLRTFADFKTTLVTYAMGGYGTPFHSFYRPRSEKAYAACNIPPGNQENRTVSDHCSLSVRECVRKPDSAVPPTHPVAVTGSSPFPADPVPGSNL